MTVATTKRYFPDGWPLPQLNDANRAFFTAGVLTIQRCEGCGQAQHPPMDVCHRCQSLSFTYEPAVGTGTIANATIVHHALDPRLRPMVPYNVVLVRPDDYADLLITGNVVNAANEDITAGRRVRCTFATVTDPVTGEVLTLPQWELEG
jgi:uncharacterized OB-fold protein